MTLLARRGFRIWNQPAKKKKKQQTPSLWSFNWTNGNSNRSFLVTSNERNQLWNVIKNHKLLRLTVAMCNVCCVLKNVRFQIEENEEKNCNKDSKKKKQTNNQLMKWSEKKQDVNRTRKCDIVNGLYIYVACTFSSVKCLNGIFDETVISNGTRPRLSSSINHIVPFHLRVLLLTVFLRNLLHWVCHWISIQNPWNNRVCFEWKFKFEFVCALKSGNMPWHNEKWVTSSWKGLCQLVLISS